MEKIVVYQSSTGFTKQYAEWIAEELGCEAVEAKKASEDMLKSKDQVIYGGWIMGNMIMGLDKIQKMKPKNLVVFAVGASVDSENVRNVIREQNKLGEEIPFFYFEGGFHFKELNFAVRGMLKMMKKSIAKKENKTDADRYMEEVLGTSFDHSDRKYIKELVENIA